MNNLLESYKVLGIGVGADMAAVTTSYRQLCREYHPDISDNPEAEELMKQVNIAYTILRDKFKREAAFREKASGIRQNIRYTPKPPQTSYTGTTPPTARTQQAGYTQTAQTEQTAQAQQNAQKRREEADWHRRKAVEQAAVSAEAETDSRKVLHDYFDALNAFDYKKAYSFLSEYDKKNISQESFIKWRESVAKLYPMREFKIAAGSSIAVVTWGGSKIFHARKFKVTVTEDDYTATRGVQSGAHDKLVIIENLRWCVFLGYKEVGELTRTFEKRFESKKKQDIEKRWEEYAAGFNTEYDMLTMTGLRKAASKEIYRQRRYGSAITFAAIKIELSAEKSSGMSELLRSAAKTISGQLREIDISAYAGDGIFVIMFIELGKKNAQNIICRLIDAIKQNADPGLGKDAQIDYSYDSWSENRYADMEEINNVLQKFGKKM